MRPDQQQDQQLDDVLRRLPQHLYRFGELSGERREWMRRLIVESDLYFARPSCFNDPLDGAIPVRFKASMLAATSHWRKVARDNDEQTREC
jgi:hypothetical protein